MGYCRDILPVVAMLGKKNGIQKKEYFVAA
jgi:hypothetical protein